MFFSFYLAYRMAAWISKRPTNTRGTVNVTACVCVMCPLLQELLHRLRKAEIMRAKVAENLEREAEVSSTL